MIPQAVRAYLRETGSGEVTAEHGVGGGCINNGARLATSSGKTYFLKTNRSAPADMFEREAEGLRELRIAGGPRAPEPYLYGSDFLLLEDLSPARPNPDYWDTFGRHLARLHLQAGPVFGFPHDNYIGSTPQPNNWEASGHTFFAEQRLLYQGRLAIKRGLLAPTELKQLERLCVQLPDLIPEQPASLIHGDLWSGNAISDRDGEPAIIDPAAHYGWAEAELAMTALFGSFPERFYQTYQEERPLHPGFWGRFPIYNLYHLLNHLNLFGSGYYGQVAGILRRF